MSWKTQLFFWNRAKSAQPVRTLANGEFEPEDVRPLTGLRGHIRRQSQVLVNGFTYFIFMVQVSETGEILYVRAPSGVLEACVAQVGDFVELSFALDSRKNAPDELRVTDLTILQPIETRVRLPKRTHRHS
jgi:hypothetical protein